MAISIVPLSRRSVVRFGTDFVEDVDGKFRSSSGRVLAQNFVDEEYPPLKVESAAKAGINDGRTRKTQVRRGLDTRHLFKEKRGRPSSKAAPPPARKRPKLYSS